MILLAIALALTAQAHTRLSDDQVDQVIAYAQTAGGFGGARCYATAPRRTGGQAGGGFAVMLSGPAGRIFDAVKAAQATGAPFSRAQVTPDMTATTLTVVAYPQDAPRATGIVIRAGGAQKIAIKPRTTAVAPAISTASGEGLRATFAYEDFSAIHLGDFDVVVLAGQSESVCTIDSTTRASIR